MAIQQTKRQSDLEKRLQLLRRQVYGKDIQSQRVKESKSQYSDTLTYQHTEIPVHRPTDTLISSDLTYLHQDLLKIATLSSLAIGSQIILYFLLKNNILNLNLF
ncbi:hypothetical protein HYU45_01825 [Candidatus Daviesbacteria bacterium]|nr:hypothetical protein [Candidatus Daviesbacteria bacterium]